MHLVPAYGRDYKSKAAVAKALEIGSDFKIADISSPWNGSYASLRDVELGGKIQVRYAKLTKVVIFTKTGENSVSE